MYILGISCFYHDAAAALLCDGQIVAAAEEERFTRVKGDSSFPQHAIDFCLRSAGIDAQDLDYVVFYEKPLLKFERILYSTLATAPRSVGLFREAMVTWFSEKLWLKSLLVKKLDIPGARILFADHHVSHAASAFFCSPYAEAALLTLDGVGEWTTTASGHATADWGDGRQPNRITLDRELRFPHSLGLLYSAFTAWLGFVVNNGEYKVMGMAPYGVPRYEDKVRKLIEVAPDSSFHLDMSYFSFHHSTQHTYNDRFVDLFGPPRHPKSEFVTDVTHPGAAGVDATLKSTNQYYADVAASIQVVVEETILAMVRDLHRRTGAENLCMAGGVALNSVANGRIVREGPFKNVWIQPAAGDSGGALGAALYVYHVLLGRPRVATMEHAYWGVGYAPGEIADFLNEQGLPYEELADDRLFAQLVDDLTAHRIVGWFQGRFEWGPRALGNRSILADPRAEAMKEIVNSKIKFREPFRPFAPAVLESHAGEFFTTPDLDQNYLARYMLLVSPVEAHKQCVIPATTHVGGTGRLQTVRPAWNVRYHRLIETFGAATGVPVLLNTSFNLRGEPIVNTPQNAFNTFVGSDIDILVLENFILRKEDMGGRWDPAFKGAVGE
jgi:carbamoyltransferase